MRWLGLLLGVFEMDFDLLLFERMCLIFLPIDSRFSFVFSRGCFLRLGFRPVKEEYMILPFPGVTLSLSVFHWIEDSLSSVLNEYLHANPGVSNNFMIFLLPFVV